MTEEVLVLEASEAFTRFYQAIDEQFASGIASVEELSRHATPAVARTWADAIEASRDRGETSRGVLEITAIKVIEWTDPTLATVLCTDGAGIVTTDAQGLVMPASGLVAWSATFVRLIDEERFVVAGLEPVQDQSVCAG